MPAAGGFSQSAVNQGAGARSQLATLTTVGLAVLVALFLAPVLSLLPEATLAAMVFTAVAGLVNIPELVRWARISRMDFWVATSVAAIGLTAGLLPAVAVGVVVTLVLVLRELNIPRVRVVGRRGSALGLEPERGLYTANALANRRLIVQTVAAQAEPVRTLVLGLPQQVVMSITVLDALEALDRELAQLGVELHLAALPADATAVAARTSWYSALAADGRVHPSVDVGLRAAADREERRRSPG